jgi:hypothetical protein
MSDVPGKDVDVQLLEACILEELLCETFHGLDGRDANLTVMEKSVEGLDNEF